MANINMHTFRDLMDGHDTASIECCIKGTIVRKLLVEGKMVTIDAMSPPVVVVDLDAEVEFLPWLMDRGSILFSCPGHSLPDDTAKLCTEYDNVRYPDGTVKTIICQR